MIKISANISKKTPLPGVEFSSQQFGAAMEVEVSDADKPEILQAKFRDLYSLLNSAVDEQIAGAAQQPQAPAAQQNRLPQQPYYTQGYKGNGGNGGNGAPQQARPARSGYATTRNSRPAGNNGNGNGATRRGGATEAQQRAIFAICKSMGLDMAAELANYNVANSADLHVKDASRLIDELKQRQNGAPAQQ